MSRWARPARPRGPLAACAVIVGLWWLVAHNAGSGWVQFLGDLVFGALLVGVLGAFVPVTRARLCVLRAPVDGLSGQPVELHVGSRRRLRVRPVDPPGPESFVGPARDGSGGVVVLVPTYRAVHEGVTVDVASAAPFGLQWWTRRVRVPLPAALHVSPRCIDAPGKAPEPDDGSGERVARPRAEEGLPRGAREYVPGDARRLVHWRATAHTGRLMVRDVERPASAPVTLTVELPGDRDPAERAAERALGAIVRLLDAGVPVVLGTREPSGPVLAPVEDRRRAGRRLARAVAGPVGDAATP